MKNSLNWSRTIDLTLKEMCEISNFLIHIQGIVIYEYT